MTRRKPIPCSVVSWSTLQHFATFPSFLHCSNDLASRPAPNISEERAYSVILTSSIAHHALLRPKLIGPSNAHFVGLLQCILRIILPF